MKILNSYLNNQIFEKKMIVRKNIGRAKSGLVLLMALGFFFAAYNLVSMIVHNKASSSGGWVADGSELFDPVLRMPGKVMGSAGSNSKFHVALTATDAAYSQWQCRIMYYWYKKVKDMPGSDMGKFTRILHSGRPDQLMDEIPTFVVDPLPEGLDRVRNFLILLSEFLSFDIFRFCKLVL